MSYSERIKTSRENKLGSRQVNFRVSTAVFWLSQRGIMVHIWYLGVVRGSLDMFYEKINFEKNHRKWSILSILHDF